MPARTNIPYLVSRDLVAYDSMTLLKDPKIHTKLAKAQQKSPSIDDRPVLDGKKKLTAGKVYRSSANKKRGYYLPKYSVVVDGQGRPGVELRFQPGDGDEEVRRLTIEVTWDVPTRSQGIDQLRAMEHRTDVILRYRVPIAASDGDAGTTAGAEQEVALQPLQVTGDRTAQSITEFADRESFEVVYAAMRTAASEATLEFESSATVWLRTYRQVLLGSLTAEAAATTLLARDATTVRMVAARTAAVEPPRRTSRTRIPLERVAEPAPRPPRRRPRPPVAARPAVQPRRMEAVAMRPRIDTARMLAAARPEARRPSAAAMLAARPMTVAVRPAAHVAAQPAAVARTIRPTATLSPAALAGARNASLSRLAARSDLTLHGRNVVPTEIALDRKNKPALLDSTQTAKHSASFHFDPAASANSDVYIAQDMGGIHLLQPLRLVSDSGKQYTVYQDNLMPDTVYVDPSVFRLVRETLAPYRPSISFVGSDFSTSDDDSEAEVFFQMMMVYRLEPWVDPEVMQLARDALAAQGHAARFIASVSSDATLELDLDFLGDEQSRVDAHIDPNEGLTDNLMLDEDAFVQLWRDRLGRPGDGVNGTVRHRLFDGTQVSTDARLSFWETSDELFATTFIGPVEGQQGRYRVSIRNRVESPVTIDELPGEALGGSTIAHAVDAASVLGTKLRPQESIELEYSVTPPDAPVTTLDPLVIGTVEPDLPALLRMMMVNSASGSLGFSLTVRAPEGTFTPVDTDGGFDDVLSGLRVEFDDGRVVELDASEPEVEVTITSRLINALMGAGGDDEQRYFYRVTNLHPTGEGARTGWLEGNGTEALEVGTAIVQLD